MYVDFARILTNTETPAYLRSLVQRIQTKGGETVGSWLQSTSLIDLISAENSEKQLRTRFALLAKNKDFQSGVPLVVGDMFMVLTDVLSSGEGLDIKEDILVSVKRMHLLGSYINAEILKRKGYDISIVYSKLSLNDEVGPGTGAEETLLIPGPLLEEQIIRNSQKTLNMISDTLKDTDPELVGPLSDQIKTIIGSIDKDKPNIH